MKIPKTVGELITILSTVPPETIVSLGGDYMENGYLWVGEYIELES